MRRVVRRRLWLYSGVTTTYASAAACRGAARLSMNRNTDELDRSGPFVRWSEITRELLEEARVRGELLPHIDTVRTADVLVGAYAGVQSMSDALSSYQDLGRRVSELLRHLVPSVVVPSVLPSLDLTPERGARVFAESTRIAQSAVRDGSTED